MKYKFNPYTKNIIFYDSEFSSLDPYKGEILSIGMVKMDGSELYLELEYDGKYDPWVKKNILPTLRNKKVSREKAIQLIRDFIGARKRPFLVSYINEYDTIYLYKLFGKTKRPFFWLPIDFASILFCLGIDPDSYYPKDKKNFFREVGIDAAKYKVHNALDDARLLREIYLKMTS